MTKHESHSRNHNDRNNSISLILLSSSVDYIFMFALLLGWISLAW
jgi:hypothetical protein